MATLSVFRLDVNGDLPAGGFDSITGIEATIQDVRTRLRFFKGEWFLDPDVGVPFFQKLLGKNPSESVIRGEIRRAIEESPTIQRVESMTLKLDRATRELQVSFRAIDTDGTVIEQTIEV